MEIQQRKVKSTFPARIAPFSVTLGRMEATEKGAIRAGNVDFTLRCCISITEEVQINDLQKSIATGLLYVHIDFEVIWTYKNNKAYRIRNTFRHTGQKQLFKHDVQAEILGNSAPSSIPNALLHLVRGPLRKRFVALRIAKDSRALNGRHNRNTAGYMYIHVALLNNYS